LYLLHRAERYLNVSLIADISMIGKLDVAYTTGGHGSVRGLSASLGRIR
jgi:hypothetical protein